MNEEKERITIKHPQKCDLHTLSTATYYHVLQTKRHVTITKKTIKKTVRLPNQKKLSLIGRYCFQKKKQTDLLNHFRYALNIFINSKQKKKEEKHE